MRIVNYEEIKRLLFEIPRLIDLFEERSHLFSKKTKYWLKKAEDILKKNNLVITSSLAVLRGQLISAERGMIPEGIVFHGKTSKNKLRDAVAASVLQKANDIIHSAVKETENKIEKANTLIKNLVVLAEKKGIIHKNLVFENHSEMLKSIWNLMDSDQDLVSGTTSLNGLVGKYDAMILLDRELPGYVQVEKEKGKNAT